MGCLYVRASRAVGFCTGANHNSKLLDVGPRTDAKSVFTTLTPSAPPRASWPAYNSTKSPKCSSPPIYMPHVLPNTCIDSQTAIISRRASILHTTPKSTKTTSFPSEPQWRITPIRHQPVSPFQPPTNGPNPASPSLPLPIPSLLANQTRRTEHIVPINYYYPDSQREQLFGTCCDCWNLSSPHRSFHHVTSYKTSQQTAPVDIRR